MIRQLYNLEDWLFYRSVSCSRTTGRMLETWSRNIGRMADRL